MSEIVEDNFKSSAERIDWIDAARGIGILLVMFGHCYLDGKFTFWFYSFHVALFFALSGYVFRTTTSYLYFIKKKIKSLLVPYITCATITIVLESVLALMYRNTYDILGTMWLYIIQNRYTPLWFITCLFVAELIMWLKSVLRQRYKVSFWLICMTVEVITFCLYQNFVDMSLPWNIDLVALALAFMSFGKWISEKLLFENLSRNGRQWAIWGMTVILSLTMAGYNYFCFGRVDWFSNSFGNYGLFVCAAVTGILAIMWISMRIEIPLLILLGKNSLLFFGLHRIIIDLTFSLYNKVGLEIVSGSYSSVILAMISVSLTIVILTPFVWCVKRYLPWCVGKNQRSIS